MRRFFVEFLGKIDDLDRVEGTLLDTDPTALAETQLLGDRDLVGPTGVVLVVLEALLAGDDTLLTRPVWGTEVRTLLVAPVGLTPV